MKKFLGLLGILTISSSVMPSIVAAAPPNRTQNQRSTNNLLPRNQCRNNQRQNCRNIKNRSISSTTRTKHKNKLTTYSNIFRNKNYKNFLRENINYFQSTKNASQIGISPINGFRKIFQLQKNTGEDKYKIIPLNTNENKIDIVLNTSNLYLDGFITNKNNIKTYWHFQEQNEGENDVIKEIEIDGNIIESKSLTYAGNYPSLKNDTEELIMSKTSINKSINNLSKFDGKNADDLKNSLVTTIFITSESIRFFSIRDEVEKVLNSDSKNINWRDYKEKITDWSDYSKKYYERIKTGKGAESKEEHDKIFDVAVLKAEKED